MAVVGIDLGTTNTVVAAVRDGRATALKDKLGRALLPSVVSFSPKGRPKVGYPAKDRRTIDPENTIFSIKRLIGRTYDSAPVSKAKERLPFLLKEGPGKSTLVSAQGQDYTLPEISALVLQEAAQVAEQRLGTQVSDVVITVPANFNDLQRAATKVAGRTAGLEVLRIINEPTAAALAYGFGKRKRERIAVYDFGGGTFDVTLLDLSENVFEVLATAGDTFLGGDDIDRALMERMAASLLKEQKLDASTDPLIREQLRAAAERLKMELSTRSMAKAKVEEIDFEFTMRRSEFERLIEPLLQRTLEVCQEAMEVAGVAPKELDQVLLVGGSTRIPLVRRRISSFFGKMPQSRINPDEVVAIGAAIQASTLEAKQGKASIPAAPRPRAAGVRQSSRAPADGAASKLGTTQTGLAGLRKTLSGSGSSSDAPARPKRPSVLSALQPAPRRVDESSGAAGGRSTGAQNKFNTLAGVGDKKSPQDSAAGERKKGTTNLGLGTSPLATPPRAEQASPQASSEKTLPALDDFDEVTTVVEAPELLARESESQEDAARDKLATLPGVAEPPGDGAQPLGPQTDPLDDPRFSPRAAKSQEAISFPLGSSAPPSDGSVTFDLEGLEAGAAAEELNDFDELEDETTQIVDPRLAERRAVALDDAAVAPEAADDSSADLLEEDLIEEDSVDLPSPSHAQRPDAPLPPLQGRAPAPQREASSTELSPEFEEDNADLPTISPHDAQTLADSSEAIELGDSALMSLSAFEESDDSDLPAPARARRSQEDGPQPPLEAPTPPEAADLPAPARRRAEHREESVDLPAPTSRKPRLGETQMGLGAKAGGRPAAQTQREIPARTRRGHQPEPDLPSLSERGGLPARPEPELPDLQEDEAGLPLVGESAEPAVARGRGPGGREASSLEQQGRSGAAREAERTVPGGRVRQAELAAGSLFGDVTDTAPRGSVAELDDLSVATAMPEEAEEAGEAGDDGSFDLAAAQRESLDDDGAFELEMAGSAPEEAPRHEAPDDGASAPSSEAPHPTQLRSALDPVPGGAQGTDELMRPAGRAPAGPLLLDVTPLSLGVEVVGGYVDRLIDRNSPIPCERTRTFATVADDQALVRVRVSQGEEVRFEENTVLGEVQLSGLPPGPRGSVKIDVSFSLDESGMLQVSARDQSTGVAARAQLMLSGVAEG